MSELNPVPLAKDIAAKMIQLGGHVIFFPRGQKHTTESEWQNEATRDMSAVERKTQTASHCNVGVVGKPDGLWLFDDDNNVLAEYESQHGKIATYRVRSVSGGTHLYFKQNDASREMGNLSGVDLNQKETWSARVNNRYVVAAGSSARQNDDANAPETYYSAIDDAPTIEAPLSFVEFLKAKAAQNPKKSNADSSSTTAEPRIVSEGGRNNYLTSLAGSFHNGAKGRETREMLLSYLRQINDESCTPPLSESEVETIANSVFRYTVNDTTVALNQKSASAAPQDVSQWRSLFRSVGEMEQGDVVMVIEGVLQEGTCFMGANPSAGKTLVGLSLAKAICTGMPLFGLPQYAVKQPRQVVYLIPESRDRAFRKRCEAFRIPDDKSKFMARTISAGVSLELSDPLLLEAVRQTKPIVFLDTASRFLKSGDENSAAQNRMLVNDVTALLAAGAVSVVILHHATKAAKDKRESMKLENMLRGTSDFGAMCDQAYGVRKDDALYANGAGPMEIEIVNLKDREQIGGLTSIRLAASCKKDGWDFPASIINETGDFNVVTESQGWARRMESLVALIKADPDIPEKELAERVGASQYTLKRNLNALGWHRVKGGASGASPWHQDNGGPCPFAKPAGAKSNK